MGYLGIERPAVVDESIDGEVIIVNLDKGLYFSIDGVGAYIWSMIGAGRTVEEIHAWIDDAFGDSAEFDADVDAFLGDLETNLLVTPTDTEPSDLSGAPENPPAGYDKPMLHVYSDMEELLLLDPIHDVDPAAGWPHASQ